MTLHSVLIKTHEEADLGPLSVIYRPVGSTMQLVTKLTPQGLEKSAQGVCKTPPSPIFGALLVLVTQLEGRKSESIRITRFVLVRMLSTWDLSFEENTERSKWKNPLVACTRWTVETLKNGSVSRSTSSFRVVWGTGTPKDRDEVNKREVSECDGWLCDFYVWMCRSELFIMNR